MNNERKSNIDCDLERIAVQLALGQIVPKTEEEKELKRQMDEIGKKGGIIQIPSN